MKRTVFPVLVLAWATSVPMAGAAWAGPHDELIVRHAAANGVPESLVRRIIQIESRGNAAAVHAGNYGLMQIRLGTARALGYLGDVRGLLDAETNLTYAVKYLAGAYRAAGCDARRAVAYYQRGYYGVRSTACNSVVPSVVEAVAKPTDVIRPKLVRTESITSDASPASTSVPATPFEPLRGAADPAPILQLASVPMPPPRPEVESPGKHNVKRAERRRHSQEKEVATAVATETVGKSSGDPLGVASFVKNLVSSDKPAPKRTADEVQPDPPSQIQPPL